MLNDVTVLEVGDRLSTGYAGKMLRDAGATVVRIEITAGSAPDSSNRDYMTFLHGGKHSVSPTSFRQLATEFPELTRRADAVICDDDDPDVLMLGRALRAQQPDLIVVSISDYGLNGAEPSTPATEFTLQAESGLTAVHATGDRPPVYTGVDLGEFAAGLNAAIGVVVGLLSIDAGAGPVDADISRYESLVSILQSPWVFSQHADHAPYAIPQAAVPGLEKAKDGWACVVSVTPQQWTAFKAMAEIPELDDPRFDQLANRLHLRAEITPHVRQFTQQYTVAELVEMGARCRVPIVPVTTSATVADLPPYTTRGTFVDHPNGFTQPRPAFRIDDETWTPGAQAEPGRAGTMTRRGASGPRGRPRRAPILAGHWPAYESSSWAASRRGRWPLEPSLTTGLMSSRSSRSPVLTSSASAAPWAAWPMLGSAVQASPRRTGANDRSRQTSRIRRGTRSSNG
jgi:crotonobetainyl-CoA:carnitine CoA-transferase CaiB-like acyl-CoA transferase